MCDEEREVEMEKEKQKRCWYENSYYFVKWKRLFCMEKAERVQCPRLYRNLSKGRKRNKWSWLFFLFFFLLVLVIYFVAQYKMIFQSITNSRQAASSVNSLAHSLNKKLAEKWMARRNSHPISCTRARIPIILAREMYRETRKALHMYWYCLLMFKNL